MSLRDDVKKLLADAIVSWVEEQKVTQVKSAALLGMTQPRLSNLMKGKLEVFSVDSLMDCLNAAGYVFCLTSEDDKLTIQMINI